MPLARIRQTLLFFAHVPKAGGTSVEAYLRAKGKLALYHSKRNDWLACSPQHIHAEIFEAFVPKGFYDHGFAVLRDPAARLQSEYRYRIGHAERRGTKLPPFDDWVPRVLRRYEANPYLQDNHLRPQVEFVADGMKLFRLENGLDQVFDWIDEVTGDNRPVPREWKKNLSGIAVDMSGETEARIRSFYAADYDFLEKAAC